MIIKKKNLQRKAIKREEAQGIDGKTSSPEKEKSAKKTDEDELEEVFDIDNIDFEQREGRRTGNRRRGYRRIDDRNLISRAQEEAIQIKEAAYQEGYSLGVEKAQADMEIFKESLNNFMGADDRVFTEIAPDIIEISLEVAKKIIKHEVQIDPQIVIDTVLDIMKNIPKNEPRITLKVNTAQVQFVKDNLPQQLILLGVESKLSILSDDNVSEGSCILQTNNGVVDASIEAQLDIVQNALRSV